MISVELTDGEADRVYKDRALALARMLSRYPYRHGQKDWGKPKPENECGTVGCAAGWCLLAGRGIVTIASDGEMTYDPSNLGHVADEWVYASDVYDNYTDVQREALTLWRSAYGQSARREGEAWLGLNQVTAYSLFVGTAQDMIVHQEQVAVEILFRLADGRVERDGAGVSLVELEDIDRSFDAAAGESE